ncbi:diguanylate cyclase [bacterium]|nr:diguanylate cyclase [bacterium]
MHKNKNKGTESNTVDSLSPKQSMTTNPIDKGGFVAKINELVGGGNTGRVITNVTVPSLQHQENKAYSSVDFISFIKEINEIIRNGKDLKDSLSSFHTMFVNRLNSSYTAFGLIQDSTTINIKLLDKNSRAYSLKVFMSDVDNEIVKAVTTGETIVMSDSSFLKVPSLSNVPSVIIPVQIQGQTTSVVIISDYNIQNHLNVYQMAVMNLGLLAENFRLVERVDKSFYMDSLTNLYSHRRFHEILVEELAHADATNTKVSVIIFDINNLSQINKDYGHAKGDEVIKVVANKINDNIKKQYVAARYAGDKIAVILKNMNSEEAKYMAEYLTYSLSCCLVDDIGPVNKLSVGIATYPDDANDNEKLIILAEQAVLVSKTKGYKNGISTIVSTHDYDFWDEDAVNSFATVMAKKQSKLGIDFENTLVEQFNNKNFVSQNHLIEVVTSLASAIDAKDEYTKDHSSSVSRYSVALAKAINLPEEEVDKIKLGARLHDVGKIGIPENILTKAAKLTDEEFKIIQQHPVIAVEKILETTPLLRELIPIVKYHHEQWNGKGYPCGLKGEEIPLAARIVAIADTYHALISDRPYRKGMSFEKACSILEEGAGIQWDKELVRQFIAIAPSLATMI